MFTRRSDKNGPVVAPRSAPPQQTPSASPPQLLKTRAAARAGSAPSVIGADLTITGNMESAGEIQIEGEIQGDIQAARVLVGERARVTGNLVADEIVVRGGVAGSIRGNNVMLQAASRVEGDIFHKSLVIEQGAFFEGKSRRSEDPTAVPRGANGMPVPG